MDNDLSQQPGPVGKFAFMKYTQSTLNRLEKIVEESGYVIRYERGTFQSGYCILEQKKVVVLNKFLQLEGRINTLADHIPELDVNTDKISEESKKLYSAIMQKSETGLPPNDSRLLTPDS